MLNAFEARLTDLQRRILADANRLPPQFQNFADETARIELLDVREQLAGCETPEEADALVYKWLGVVS